MFVHPMIAIAKKNVITHSLKYNMQLQKNDYLKKGNIYRRVIEVLGEVVFPSMAFGSWNDKNSGVLMRESSSTTCTVAELEADGWTKCTPQEAGAPEEKWESVRGKLYHYAYYDGFTVYSRSVTWDAFPSDKKRLAIGNVHKTKDEAIAWLKSKLDLKV